MSEQLQNVEMMRFQVMNWRIASNYHMDVATPAVMAYALITSGPNSVTNIFSILNVDTKVLLESLDKTINDSLIPKRKTKASENIAVSLSTGGREIIRISSEICSLMGDPSLNTHHVMLAILKSSAAMSKIFSKHGVVYSEFMRVVKQTTVPPIQIPPLEKNKKEVTPNNSGTVEAGSVDNPRKQRPVNDKEVLSKYCKDLTELASQGKLDPVIGREKEISRLVTTLCRRKKNNAILVGEPGVGKTAVVEGFAQRISEGNVPKQMLGHKVFQLNMTAVVSRTIYRGQFEERMRAVMELFAAHKEYVLFVDEIHTLIGSGGSVGGLDTANIMKPALAGGNIRCIGATTEDEYRRFFKKDGALDRRFQRVFIDEPSADETYKILSGIRQIIENHHDCVISDDVIKLAVELSSRYVTDRYLPDKAIDCLDEACSAATSRQKDSDGKLLITREDIILAIACQTDMPTEVVGVGDVNRARSLKQYLKDRIIGQDTAIDTVSALLLGAFAGLRDIRRPIGCFVFGGPSGSGTTYMAEQMAEGLFESSTSLVRINMAEFSESFGSTKLIGSPPGYIGYGDSNQLTDKVARRPYCLILLDGIEHAADSVIKLFMAAMSKGVMTDSSGKEINFRNSVIIMTMTTVSSNKSKKLGFSDDAENNSKNLHKDLVMECRKVFGEDFINNVDEFIPFVDMGTVEVATIAKRRLDILVCKLADLGMLMSYSDDVVNMIVSESFVAGHPNAKKVDKYVRRCIEPVVSELLSSRETVNKCRLVVESGHIVCTESSVMAESI